MAEIGFVVGETDGADFCVGDGDGDGDDGRVLRQSSGDDAMALVELEVGDHAPSFRPTPSSLHWNCSIELHVSW